MSRCAVGRELAPSSRLLVPGSIPYHRAVDFSPGRCLTGRHRGDPGSAGLSPRTALRIAMRGRNTDTRVSAARAATEQRHATASSRCISRPDGGNRGSGDPSQAVASRSTTSAHVDAPRMPMRAKAATKPTPICPQSRPGDSGASARCSKSLSLTGGCVCPAASKLETDDPENHSDE